MKLNLTTQHKQKLAKIVSWPPIYQGMKLGIWLFAPKHRIGVNAVCVDNQQRVLLLNHVFHPQYPWGLPGGWLNRNEKPEACLQRELFEETGLTAEIDHLLHLHQAPYPSHLVFIYHATITGGQLNITNNEILEARWFTAAEMPSPLLPATRIAINKALNIQI